MPRSKRSYKQGMSSNVGGQLQRTVLEMDRNDMMSRKQQVTAESNTVTHISTPGCVPGLPYQSHLGAKVSQAVTDWRACSRGT